MDDILRTRLCEVLGVEVPVVQAPIGSASCPELAAAISEAGGVGMLALSWKDEAGVRAAIRETRRLTDKPFGVNLVLEWSQEERLAACLEEGAEIVSFFWGDPTPYATTVHQAGGLAVHTIGSAQEALLAVEAGADVIVAQGWEAGGHVWGGVATMALVPAVVDALRESGHEAVPVLAAGGIADGRGLAAALVLGASGAWMGTRFLLSAEAAAHEEYKGAVARAPEADTAYSTLFDGGWTEAPHRTLRNSTVRAWEEADKPPTGQRPGEGEVLAEGPGSKEVRRYDDVIPLPSLKGDLEALALYAGQSVGLASEVAPARRIIEEIVRCAADTLDGIGGGRR